jgi:hypothetical protein
VITRSSMLFVYVAPSPVAPLGVPRDLLVRLHYHPSRHTLALSVRLREAFLFGLRLLAHVRR